MLTAGIAMAPGLEQGNALQSLSVPGAVKGISFAESFGEAAGAALVKSGIPEMLMSGRGAAEGSSDLEKIASRGEGSIKGGGIKTQGSPMDEERGSSFAVVESLESPSEDVSKDSPVSAGLLPVRRGVEVESAISGDKVEQASTVEQKMQGGAADKSAGPVVEGETNNTSSMNTGKTGSLIGVQPIPEWQTGSAEIPQSAVQQQDKAAVGSSGKSEVRTEDVVKLPSAEGIVAVVEDSSSAPSATPASAAGSTAPVVCVGVPEATPEAAMAGTEDSAKLPAKNLAADSAPVKREAAEGAKVEGGAAAKKIVLPKILLPKERAEKSKVSAPLVQLDPTTVGVATNASGLQGMSAPVAITPTIAQPVVREKAAKGDADAVSALSGSAVMGRAKRVVEGQSGKARAHAEAARRDAKDESGIGPVITGVTAGQQGNAGVEHGKTATAAAPVAGTDDVKAHGPGSAVGAATVQSVAAVPGHFAGDGVPSKLHASAGASSGADLRSGPRVSEPAHAATEGQRTLAATPTTLEIGVASGTHGWLKVRAEMTSGGAVNASVSASSSSGQEMLHRELASLTAYLHEERVGVNSIVLHVSHAEAGSRPLGGGMEGDSGRGQMQQDGGRGGENRQTAEMPMVPDAEEGFSFDGARGAEWLTPAVYAGVGGGGGWLSVRA